MATRYIVTLGASVSRDLTIEAESPEEAVRLATENLGSSVVMGRPLRLHPRSVETDDEDPNGVWSVMGKCETCEKPLLMPESTEPRRFVAAGMSGDDTVYICLACAAKFEADEAANGGQS